MLPADVQQHSGRHGATEEDGPLPRSGHTAEEHLRKGSEKSTFKEENQSRI